MSFKQGHVSGLVNDDLIGEVAATYWLIDNRSGRTAIEPKESLKVTLGRSPDLADALMLSELGDEHFSGSIVQYPFLPSHIGALTHAATVERAERGGPQIQDAIDDAMGDATFFVHDREQLLAGQGERRQFGSRWGYLGSGRRRKCW